MVPRVSLTAMKKTLCSLAAVAALVLAGIRPAPAPHVVPHRSEAGAGDALARLPLAFVENRGQWDANTKFMAHRSGMALRVAAAGISLHLARRPEAGRVRGAVVHLTLEGATGAAVVEGEEALPGRFHYFLGSDPARWRNNVVAYASVLCRGVQEGVDLRLREAAGTVEYDVILEPGADLGGVVVRCDGVDDLRVEPDGTLTMVTALGVVRQSAPVTWQVTAGGDRQPVEARFRRLGPDRYGFEVPERDASLELVIDPGLQYSTFVGGLGNEFTNAMALDASGGAVVVGFTDSALFVPFPTTAGAYDTTFNGVVDAFVARLSPSGASLVYATYLGGAGDDRAHGVAVDASGAATVVGYTGPDFPTTPGAYDTTPNGSSDAFVTRLSPDGSSLLYSSFLGASGPEQAMGVALDAAGHAAVTGWTQSTSFPIAGAAFDATYSGGFNDAFVARLSASGSSLLYSTYLGGTGDEIGRAVGVDPTGAVTVAGETGSLDFPRSAPHNGGARDAFVTRLSPSGSSLLYSHLIGGTNVDIAHAVAVDATGAAALAGVTSSTDFPATAGAFDTSPNGGFDGFVVRVSATGSLTSATYVGGTGDDAVHAVALDTADAVTVVGVAGSGDYPTTPGAFLRGNGTGAQPVALPIVTRLSASMASLLYSTYLSLSHGEPRAVAFDAAGAATVAGSTASVTFPTTAGAFDRLHNGGQDVFVTRLDLLPTGVTAYGASTPGCSGALVIGVSAIPAVGNAAFAITCASAPPSASGALFVAGAGLSAPIPILGAHLWLDPASAFFAASSAQANAAGVGAFSLPLPSTPALVGQRLDAQFFWIGPASPPPCPPLGISTSNALAIVIQP